MKGLPLKAVSRIAVVGAGCSTRRHEHYDLFAGIGGFSLALEEIFTDATIRHIFCEWESFPTSVLRQHWPDGEFYGDIADLVAHTGGAGLEEAGTGQQAEGSRGSSDGHADDTTDTLGARPPHRLPEQEQRARRAVRSTWKRL
jgi:hypothetical protein